MNLLHHILAANPATLQLAGRTRPKSIDAKGQTKMDLHDVLWTGRKVSMVFACAHR